MRSAFGRFIVYAKVTFVVVLVLALVVLVWKNMGYTTNFWPGAAKEQLPTLWLILITSILSIVVYWILSKTRRVFRELAEIRAQKLDEQERARREQRRKELDDQERRIDEKLKKAVGTPPSPDSRDGT